MLENLVANAIKFSPDGSVVRLVAQGAEDDVCFQVVDEGVGIQIEDRKRRHLPQKLKAVSVEA